MKNKISETFHPPFQEDIIKKLEDTNILFKAISDTVDNNADVLNKMNHWVQEIATAVNGMYNTIQDLEKEIEELKNDST